jgi:hypothetical protein
MILHYPIRPVRMRTVPAVYTAARLVRPPSMVTMVPLV